MLVRGPARFTRALAVAVLAALGVPCAGTPACSQAPAAPADAYTTRIKPIFETRCVACHSCFNAPCQLNLQSHAGVARGTTTLYIYDAQRTRSVAPTRLDIDASTTAAWREKGFFDVLGAGTASRSLLLALTELRSAHANLQPRKSATESQLCTTGTDDPRIADNAESLGMPYGMPPLAPEQIAALKAWIADGAPGPISSSLPERAAIPPALRADVRMWERFLNGTDARQKLVSRYLYEHLFLADLHFAADGQRAGTAAADAGRPTFFRLVRSRTPCETGIEEIATRRPTDAPGTPQMFYCLRPMLNTVVDKKHVAYALSPAKLARIKSLFLGTAWAPARGQDYGSTQANNPFATFAAIPVKARYQFLLDDAQYHVATFIKGPVCNGTMAVNSIQEQFFVFFLKPEADGMAMLPDYAAKAQKLLILPGMWGSDVAFEQDLPFLARLVEHREHYRKLRTQSVARLRPNGYALDDIWDGDGENPNALLTVFRHDDNAAVLKGAVGDLPKTVFVLDYPLFERLVYNLVVNFDVFGNVGHQVLTRIYMDLIRMEAEELFLSFLPPPQRRPLRSAWYQGGLLTEIKLNYVFPLRNESQPTAVKFRSETGSKAEFVQRALFERLPAKVRGRADLINWRALQVPPGAEGRAPLSAAEQALRGIAAVPAVKATPFSQFFPELSLLLLRGQNGKRQLYSIARNREHLNVSWIMGEQLRLAPEEDTLTVREGALGSYPNMFFVLDEADAGAFAAAAAGITSPEGYEALVDRFGVRRTSQAFWRTYDAVNGAALALRPIEGGTLDLSRYELARP